MSTEAVGRGSLPQRVRARPSAMVRCYLGSLRVWRFGIEYLLAGFKGFWLGVLRSDHLHAIDGSYYDGHALLGAAADQDYRSEEYNQRGLFPWEVRALEGSFPSSGHLLLLGAGGGREAVALLRMGFRVDAFECHPDLMASANELLRRIDLVPCVRPAPRDALPADPNLFSPVPYDGVIVGWGAFMLIRGRKRRIRLLKQIRDHVAPGCPVLLSFFTRQGTPRWMRTIARVGSATAWVCRGEPVELGDDLRMNYVHHFTRDEIERELDEAGFELVVFGTEEYGHAVARLRVTSLVPVDGRGVVLREVPA